MKITRELLKALRPEIEGALTAIAERHNITLNLGNASYKDHDFSFKLIGQVQDIGDGRPAAAAEWDLYRSRFGLDGIEYGTSFTTHSGTYTVDGILPRSRKYPVLGLAADGERRKFKPSSVLLGKVTA